MNARINDIAALGVLAGLASSYSCGPLRGAIGIRADEFDDFMRMTAAGGYRDFQRPNPAPRTLKQKQKAARRAKAKAGRKAAHVGRRA